MKLLVSEEEYARLTRLALGPLKKIAATSAELAMATKLLNFLLGAEPEATMPLVPALYRQLIFTPVFKAVRASRGDLHELTKARLRELERWL
jgi:hypothetical protein